MNLKILKTSLAVIMTLLIVVSTAGCSIDEWEFYSLSKELDQMNTIEANGTVSVTLGDELLNEMQYDFIPELENAGIAFDKEFEIRYSFKGSREPLAYEVKLDYRKKGDADYKKITTVIGDDKAIYYNLKDYLIFFKPFVLASKPSEEKVINALIEKVDYMKVDLTSGNNAIDYSAVRSDSEDLTRIVTGFVDVFKEAYSGYSSGVINKKGNGYEFRLEAKDIKPLIIKFAEYTITNIDTIYDKASAKINSMPEEDIAYLAEALNDSSMDKEELLYDLENFRNDIKEITPEQMDELKNDESIDMMFDSLEGSVINTYLEKEADGIYKSVTDLNVKYMDETMLSLKNTTQTKKLDAFSIAIPAKSTTMEEVQSIVASVLPPQVDLVKIDLKTKKTTVTYSDKKTSNVEMPYSIIEGSTYASLDTVNKTLGTKITWDERSQMALTDRDGALVEIAAKKVNGKIYIKLIDLEGLDYSVWYNAKTHEVIIRNLTRQSIFM